MFNFMQGFRPQQQQQAAPQRPPMKAMGQQPQPNQMASMMSRFGGQQAPQQSQMQRAFGGAFGGKQQSRFGMGQPQGQMPKQNQLQGAMGGMGGMGMLSDKHSKERIQELEDLTSSYEALMNRDQTVKPELRQPDTDALDRAARAGAHRDLGSYEYDYKDPNAPGAAPGRQVGFMAHEARGLPGVVERGPDGLDRINEPRLTLANASAIGEQQRNIEGQQADIDELKDAQAALEKRRMMGALDEAGKRQTSRILSDNPY